MSRRREQHATQSKGDGQPLDEMSARCRSWTEWRPRRRVGLLAVTVFLLLVWLGFLLAMIALK